MSIKFSINEKGRSGVDFVCAFSLIAVVFLLVFVGASKYRVYKHSGEFESLFDNTLRVYSYIGDQNSENVAGMFNVFKLVPDGMKYDKNVFSDNFDSSITVKNRSIKRKDGGTEYDYYMFVNFHDPYMGLVPSKPKVCNNFLKVIRKNADKIEWVDIRQGAALLNFKMFGKEYCEGRNCISSMTNKNIEDICYYCTSDTYCSIYIQLKTKLLEKKKKKSSKKQASR